MWLGICLYSEKEFWESLRLIELQYVSALCLPVSVGVFWCVGVCSGEKGVNE